MLEKAETQARIKAITEIAAFDAHTYKFIDGEPSAYFSAWDYARQRCAEICGES